MSNGNNWDETPISSGNHEERKHGVCALEMVAWMAGEAHSDTPRCVGEPIRTFIKEWNDDLRSDEEREMLRPVLPLIIGTVHTPSKRDISVQMCEDWLTYEQAPAWLRLVPSLEDFASAIEECERGTDEELKLMTHIDSRLRRLFEDVWRRCPRDLSITDNPLSVALELTKASGLDAAYRSTLQWRDTSPPSRDICRSVATVAAYSLPDPRSGLEPIVQTTQKSALQLLERMVKVQQRDSKRHL